MTIEFRFEYEYIRRDLINSSNGTYDTCRRLVEKERARWIGLHLSGGTFKDLPKLFSRLLAVVVDWLWPDIGPP